MLEFLRQLPLFSDLSDADLGQLCTSIDTLTLEKDQLLFTEGSPGDKAYIIEQGEIEIYKRSDKSDVVLAIRKSGEVIGEMSLIESLPRAASARALTRSTLYALSAEPFQRLLSTSPTACWSVLHTVTARYRATETLVRQNEKMAQLGTLAAGMAHELNNPASAVQRGASQLLPCLERLQTASQALLDSGVVPAHQEHMRELERETRQRATQTGVLSPLDISDRESELEEWLEENGVPDGWELATPLASIGYTKESLQVFSADYSLPQLSAILGWVSALYQILTIHHEIQLGAGRIAEIVRALKGYIYLDQAPVQAVDLHEGLENTLVLLRSRCPDGIQVVRDYDPHLPKPEANGGELNQVWTHLIENALDSLVDTGTLTLRTRIEEDCVLVEVQDDGPGIPAQIQQRVFDPFFTTKPPGKGAGLGLNIAYHIIQKHGGQILLHSQPGDTRFTVRLPLIPSSRERSG